MDDDELLDVGMRARIFMIKDNDDTDQQWMVTKYMTIWRQASFFVCVTV
jgi:hypothetical protein